MAITRKKRNTHRVALTLGALAIATIARPTELIQNGDFEKGDLSGWSTSSMLSGSFLASMPGADTPLTSSPTMTNAGGGTAYAVSDQDSFDGGANVIYQDFVVPANVKSAHLSFDMFVTDWAGFGAIVDPSGLDPTTGGLAQPRDNQHGRVDLMRPGNDDFNTATDVISNLYLGVDAGVPADYKHYSFDLTNDLGLPATYRLRFGVVENLAPIQMGFDNVHLEINAAPVPEPTTLIGVASLLAVLRRRRRV